jgi:hypothetical protein
MLFCCHWNYCSSLSRLAIYLTERRKTKREREKRELAITAVGVRGIE